MGGGQPQIPFAPLPVIAMAEKLKDFTPNNRPGPDPKHRWDQWFDGSIWKLTAGYDFTCTLASMRQQIYAAARERGYVVSVFTELDESALIIKPREWEWEE